MQFNASLKMEQIDIKRKKKKKTLLKNRNEKNYSFES